MRKRANIFAGLLILLLFVSPLIMAAIQKTQPEPQLQTPRQPSLSSHFTQRSVQHALQNDGTDVQDVDIQVERFKHNPIVTPEMLPGDDGSNINGPSLIRVPDWIESPLGKYYLYFAHHNGTYIRLAYADSLEGPWKIHGPGVLRIEETILGHGVEGAHIASPDVHVDHETKEIRMYFHGTCPEEYDCQQTYGQGSSVAISRDGINFTASNKFLEDIYFRVFKWKDEYYAFARGGTIYKSDDKDGFKGFKRLRESSTFPGLGKDAAIRHVAVKLTDKFLYVFYSCLGHVPERILVSVFRLSDDWISNWKLSDPMEVLKSKEVYEGIEFPIKPSEFGSAKTPVHELRDPFIFTENGQNYLLYSVAGEFGIAIARLTIIRGKESD